MESLYLLIPLGVMVVAAATWVFIASAMGGQFEDLDRQQGELPDHE